MVARNGLAFKQDFAVGRLIHARHAVKGRGFARAVGADQRHDLAAVDFHAQVVYRHHAAKLHGQVVDFQHVLAHFAASFPLRPRRRSGSSRSPMMPLRKNSTTTMMITENTTRRKPLRSSGTWKDPMV